MAEDEITGRLEQLLQLTCATWDGNLISKAYRDEMVKAKYADRILGWNMANLEGMRVLINLGYLQPQRKKEASELDWKRTGELLKEHKDILIRLANAQRAVEILKKALEFYANENNYDGDCAVVVEAVAEGVPYRACDLGGIARAALDRCRKELEPSLDKE